jgi:hypothetical protein
MAQEVAEGSALHAVAVPTKEPEQDASYCPCCSKQLEPRQCKMICTSCGYYMSCSDFY